MFKSIAIAAVAGFAFLATPAMAEGVSPEAIDGATTVDAGKAKELFDNGVTFVDVRKDSDWDAGRIPGAHHIELKGEFSQDSLGDVVSADTEVVFYCNGESCMRSSKASAQAVDWGYKKVYYYRDGIPSWESAGYPVE